MQWLEDVDSIGQQQQGLVDLGQGGEHGSTHGLGCVQGIELVGDEEREPESVGKL